MPDIITDGAAATNTGAAQPAAGTEGKPASPVSTTKPTPSILSDAGKPATDAAGGDKSILDSAKAEGDDKAKADDAAKPVEKTVPEKYEIKAPEGIPLDQAAIEAFTPLAKELKLSNEEFQKLVDYRAKEVKAATDKQAQDFDKFRADTKAETLKEFGPKLQEELPYVAKARDQFADSEVMQLLDDTGLSSHKAFIRMFGKIGRAVSEDKRVDGRTTPAGLSDGQIMFPNQGKA